MTDPENRHAGDQTTTWDIPTVMTLLLRTIAVVTAVITVYNIQTIFDHADWRAAGAVVSTLLMGIGAVALWFFAEPIVQHMRGLHADAAPKEPEGESLVEAARRTSLFEWHAMFLSLVGIVFIVVFAFEFLSMLSVYFHGYSGGRVFTTLLVLAVSFLFAFAPKTVLKVLPMYKAFRTPRAKKDAETSDDSEGMEAVESTKESDQEGDSSKSDSKIDM